MTGPLGPTFHGGTVRRASEGEREIKERTGEKERKRERGEENDGTHSSIMMSPVYVAADGGN